MIRYAFTKHPDGSTSIKIGRKTTYLRTGGEADAFIAGFKTAHLKLSEAIEPFLKIKDKDQ